MIRQTEAAHPSAPHLRSSGHAQRRPIKVHDDRLDAGIVRGRLEGLNQAEQGQLRLFEQLGLRGETQLWAPNATDTSGQKRVQRMNNAGGGGLLVGVARRQKTKCASPYCTKNTQGTCRS